MKITGTLQSAIYNYICERINKGTKSVPDRVCNCNSEDICTLKKKRNTTFNEHLIGSIIGEKIKESRDKFHTERGHIMKTPVCCPTLWKPLSFWEARNTY